jgi:hypothetical protein
MEDSTMQDKNFICFVQNSCSDAVSQDKEYMKLQSDYLLAQNCGDTGSQEEIQCEMEARAEEICFMAGFRAAMQIYINGLSQ